MTATRVDGSWIAWSSTSRRPTSRGFGPVYAVLPEVRLLVMVSTPLGVIEVGVLAVFGGAPLLVALAVLAGIVVGVVSLGRRLSLPVEHPFPRFGEVLRARPSDRRGG